MRLLLDTHILVWFSGRAGLLLPAEEAAIAAAEDVAATAVSIWELRLKWNRRHLSGERKGPADPQDILTWIGSAGLRVLDLTADMAAAPLDPPLAHSDPFDELLLTQAQQGGYRLLTRDAKLAAHPLALVA